MAVVLTDTRRDLAGQTGVEKPSTRGGNMTCRLSHPLKRQSPSHTRQREEQARRMGLKYQWCGHQFKNMRTPYAHCQLEPSNGTRSILLEWPRKCRPNQKSNGSSNQRRAPGMQCWGYSPSEKPAGQTEYCECYGILAAPSFPLSASLLWVRSHPGCWAPRSIPDLLSHQAAPFVSHPRNCPYVEAQEHQ